MPIDSKRVINNTMNKDNKKNSKENILQVQGQVVDKIVIRDKATKKTILDKRG